jgi:serine/threonine-protein kinase RsbT
MTPPPPESRSVRIRVESDVAEASRVARDLAESLGFGGTDVVHVATAVSELARNQLQHAVGGTVTVDALDGERGAGISVDATDEGPGIDEVERALEDGFSTRGSLGLGLPGARRLVDEFELDSTPGEGTTVRMVKWRNAPGPDVRVRLAEWAVAGDPAEAVAQPFDGGLLLAVARPDAASVLRTAPALPPARALEASGAADGIAVCLSGLDGHIAWMRTGTASGLLLRRRGDRVAAIADAPRHRAQTIGVRRGDVLLLSSAGRPNLPDRAAAALASDNPHAVADAALAAGAGTALAARLLRGVLERRGRP